MNNDRTVAASEDPEDPGLKMNMPSEPWFA